MTHLIFGFILSSIGEKPDMVCTVPNSNVVYMRESSSLEKKVQYRNNRAQVTEQTSLSSGWVSIEKYGKTITFEFVCKKSK